jgi:hypothetical protein
LGLSAGGIQKVVSIYLSTSVSTCCDEYWGGGGLEVRASSLLGCLPPRSTALRSHSISLKMRETKHTLLACRKTK